MECLQSTHDCGIMTGIADFSPELSMSDMDDEMCLRAGRNISRARRARKLTQEEVARAAGIGLNTLRRAERGDCGVTFGNYSRILRVFGMESHIGMLANPSLDSEILNKTGAELPKKVVKPRGSRARALAEALLPPMQDDLSPDMA